MASNDPADKQCPEISDSDIFEAMKEIQGYLDITPSDLKEIYRHAFRHAQERIDRPIKAAEIMTRGVHRVGVDTPLAEAAELMAHNGVSGVPVLDETGRVAGVISEKDFLMRMGAADIMAAPAITVREDVSTIEILALFAARSINRVPVVDGSGKLAGIVSRADILRAQTAARG